MTLSPVAEQLAVERSLPVLTTEECRGCDSNSQSSVCEVNALIGLSLNVLIVKILGMELGTFQVQNEHSYN